MSWSDHFVEVEVLNWESHNERRDRKNYVWFKFENNFFSDAKIHHLTLEGKMMFIYLLCEASKKSSSRVLLHFNRILVDMGLSKKKTLEILSTLEEIGLIARQFQATAGGCQATAAVMSLDKKREEEIAGSRDKRELPAEHDVVPIVSGLESIGAILQERGVTFKVQAQWVEAYPDPPWICDQVRRALIWESSNPLKRKKIFTRFMSGWLSRSWDKRKFQPSTENLVLKNFHLQNAEDDDVR